MMNKKSSTQKNAIKKYEFVDVTPSYYGVIEKKDGEDTVVVLINKNEKIPCSVTKSYFTKYDNQRSINIRITQANDLTDDPKWGQIVWDGNLELPSGRPAGQEVKVTYSYDENGIMHASFLDVASGNETDTSFTADTDGGDDNPDPNKPNIDKILLDDDVNEVDKWLID